MKLSRNLPGKKLVRALEKVEYHATRQTSSHMRIAYDTMSQHTIAVPLHDLRVGTLAAILVDVAAHHELTRDDLIFKLFGKS